MGIILVLFCQVKFS